MSAFSGFMIGQRSARRISVSELAERANVSVSAISRLESGDLEPSKDLALRLAKALETNEDDWLLAAGFLPEDMRTAISLEPQTAISTIKDSLPATLQSYSRLISSLRVLVDELLPAIPKLSANGAREVKAYRSKPGTSQTDEGLAVDAVLLEVAYRLAPQDSRLPFDSWVPSLRRLAANRMNDDIVKLATTICKHDERMMGLVFEALSPRARRYELGQYFTPPVIARHMGKMVKAANPETVLDPAVGAGVLFSELKTSTRLMGLDINPVCAALSLAGLASRGYTSLDISVGDFLEDKQSLFSRGSRSTAQMDAVICNPPYMRHHLLDGSEKKRMTSSYSAQFGVRLSTLATSYVYFFLESLSRLKPGGTLVFITPADYLDVNYGVGLKQILKERTTIEEIMLFDRDALAFEGVMTTSAITVAKNTPAPSCHFVSFKEAEMSNAEEVTTARPNRRRQSELDSTNSWSTCFGDREDALNALVNDRPRRLSDYLRIRRGIATGDNKFFVVPQSVVDKWEIEQEFLLPVITSARDLPDGVLTQAHWERLKKTGRPCWFVNCDLPKSDLKGKKILKYIEHGETLGVHERFNCRARNPWYKGERVAVPDVIITYMNRGRTRFVENRSNCRVMSVFINGYLIDDQTPVTALLEGLNSSETSDILNRIGRVYGGGLGKVEPGTLASLPMPEIGKAAERSTTRTSKGPRADAPKPNQSPRQLHRPDNSDRNTRREIG